MNQCGPILITGAGKNIGFDLAITLRQLNYDVIAHYHSDTPNIETLTSHGIETYSCDLNDIDETKQLCAKIARNHPRLRAVIHNASQFAKSSEDIDIASFQFQQFYAIHMQAPFIINQSLSKQLIAGGPPADIIHITDIYSENPNPVFDIYCATKAGLENLSKSFAKKLAPNVKVNTIQPGPISFKPWHDEQTREKIVSETLLKQVGNHDVIIQAVISILNNPFMTGACIKVDGGRHLTQS